MSFKEILKQSYDFNFTGYPFLNDWKRHPYTFLKARYWMIGSSFIAYLLQNTPITPNFMTLVVIIIGFISIVLFSFNSNLLLIIALLIIFNKGVLKASDGTLARVKKMKSNSGFILDCYSGLIFGISLYIGLGIHAYRQTGYELFLFSIPFLIIFTINKLNHYSKLILFDYFLTLENNIGLVKKNKMFITTELTNENKLLTKLYSILDDRARSVDLICLLILFELYTSLLITPYIYGFIFIKQMAMFSLAIYRVVTKTWVDNILSATIYKLNLEFLKLNRGEND